RAGVCGPPQRGKPPDPGIVVADLRPDWFFIGYFTVLALMPPGAEGILIVGIPLLVVAFLFALPFVRPFGQRHPMRRPFALAAADLVIGGDTPPPAPRGEAPGAAPPRRWPRR